MTKKLTSLVLAGAVCLCPLTKLTCAADRDDLTSKIAAILTQKETSADEQQGLDATIDESHDVQKLKAALEKYQIKEKIAQMQNKKKAERKQKLIKYFNMLKEALQFSAALIINGVFVKEVI